jgi:PAS domain S-box-containing protein
VDIVAALERVLDSALDIGASAARIYLLPSIIPEGGVDKDAALRLGSGLAAERYSYLDEQVTMLNEKQEVLKLNNLSRPRLFSNPEDQIPPQAILAIALKHESQLLGSLWVAFDLPHQFVEEEIRYISTLAGQAVLAVENSRLYLTSEIGRQRLASVLDATPDAVLVTDQEDNLLLLNSAAEDLFRLYDGDGIGVPISKSIADEQLKAIYGNQLLNLPSDEITLMDGNTYHASISTVEVEGIEAGRVCVLRNVTTIKQLNASKSDFVSTVSHDLRSPLALIQGYTSMLQMVGELNDQQSSYLKKISDETEKISHLVTNLLDLGRIEAEVGLHLDKKAVDDVIDRVVAASKVQADQKRINLSTRIEHNNLPIIEADQALLQQALYNLVDNAIKFTEPGGEVIIGLELSVDRVIYIIEDNGIGISPADQQYLFDKFFKSTNQQRLEAGGSGLGLAIASSIAETHSGKITVKSKLGIGSTFYFELPLRQSTK